jgi:hypothetical protein
VKTEKIAEAPTPAAAPTPAETIVPAVAPTTPAPETPAAPVEVAATPMPAPVPAKPVFNPPDAPRLQGIFYVPGKSTALIADKSVRAGDKILRYRVREIGQASVILVDADGKAIVLTLDN